MANGENQAEVIGTLANLDPQTGAAPRRRISSANQVRMMFNRTKTFNDRRSKRNALVAGLVDGNPPFDDSALSKSGQKYRSNFNNGEAESFLNVAIGAFYDLFSETETCVTVDFPANIAKDPNSKDWADGIAQEFNTLLRSDEDWFDSTIQLSQLNMVLYGFGPLVWDDLYDWKSEAIQFKDIYLPQRAPAQVKKWPWVMFYTRIPIDELYMKISDSKLATECGWHVEEVKKAIILSGQSYMSQSYPNSDWTRWETWQEQLRNNDLAVADLVPGVECIRLLYREFSGKVSEVWVPLVSGSGTGPETNFLFTSFECYDCMSNAVAAMFYDRGTGYAHSVRGLGVKLYRLLLAKMRLQNGAVDSAFARMSIMLQQKSNDATISPVHLGPYTVLPSGVDFIANTAVPGVIDAPLAVSRDLDNTLSSNVSQYRQRLEQPQGGNPRTAYEVAASVNQSAMLNKTQISRYYLQLDLWYAETYRRAISKEIPKDTDRESYEAAIAFQAAMRKRGIPDNAIKEAKIKAFRVVGQGSAMVRNQQLGFVFQTLFGELPEDGRQRLKKDLVASSLGYSAVNRYMPEAGFEPLDAEQRWEAQLENSTFRQGGQITLAPNQNDAIHLDEHMVFAAQAMQSLEQGADPHEIWQTLSSVGPHMQMHLLRLARSPLRLREVNMFRERLQKVAEFTTQLEKQLASDAGVQQPQGPGPSAEDQIKMQEAQLDMQIKSAKAQQDLSINAAKARQDLAINDAMSAEEVRRNLGKQIRENTKV